MRRLAPYSFLLGAVLMALPALAEPTRLALVVGNNTAQTPELETLSFADDDALQTGELLASLGFDVTVLASPDADTSRLVSNSTQVAPPARANVLAAIRGMIQEAERLSDLGIRPTLYFSFAGHGSYDAEGRGFLHLADGRLTLRDLVYELVIPTQGLCDVVIMLDSCNAEFLVKSRGSATRRPAGQTTLRLEEYRHVGLVLSSSATGEVREWGRFLGGVFSHQLRSALMGGADQDCDGYITFPELAAFLQAANEGVANPALRLKPYVRAPLSNPSLTVAAPAEALDSARLLLDAPRPLRLTVLDSNLARRADVNLDGSCPRELVLIPGRTYTFSIASNLPATVPPSERTAMAGSGQKVSLASLPVNANASLAARGTDDYYRQHLFEIPFGNRYFASYVAGPYQESLLFERSFEAPWYTNGWGWLATGTGLAAATVASVFMVMADDAAESAADAHWASDIARFNQRVDQYNTASGIAWAAAGAALVTGTLLFLFDTQWETEQVVPQFDGPVVVRPNEVGISLELHY